MLPASWLISESRLGRGGGHRSPSCIGAWEDVACVVLNSPGREDGWCSVLGFVAESGGQPVWVVGSSLLPR